MPSAAETLPPVVVMGVQGSGKSTVAAALAEALDAEFLDGDDLHPAANRAKLAAGQPLDDDDRWPWLRLVAARLGAAEREGARLVVACSALRRAYRDLLRADAATTRFVHLDGPREVLVARIAARTHAFMPTTLLDSQLATLEPLQPDEHGIVLDLREPVPQLVAEAVRAIG